MTSTLQDPIDIEWTTAVDPSASAKRLCERLAPLTADQLRSLTPAMAAAAAELALLTGVSWRFSPDDPAIALLRMIARVAIVAPDAGGPHCARLAEVLDDQEREDTRR